MNFMIETKKKVTNVEKDFQLEFNNYKTDNTELVLASETIIKNQKVNLEKFDENIFKMEGNNKISLDHLEIKLVEQINNQDWNFKQIESKFLKKVQDVKESFYKDYNSRPMILLNDRLNDILILEFYDEFRGPYPKGFLDSLNMF